MTDRNVAVVGTPGGWSSESLADVFEARFGRRILVDLKSVCLDLERGTVSSGEIDLSKMDAIWVKKAGQTYAPHLLDRLELLRYVASKGVRIFSAPEKIMGLLNRISCTVTLAANGIPMPPTRVTEDLDQAVEAVRVFESVILKPLFSTKARGMEVLTWTDESDVRENLRAYQGAGNPTIYIQKKIDIGESDFGFIFLGGEYLGAYSRVRGDESWNTTIHAGGRYENFEPDADLIRLAEKAQAPFGLDFTGVDVALTPQGPIVFEVSAFGGFKGVTQGTGVDVMDRVADYVAERLT